VASAANKKCGAFMEIKKMVSECFALFPFVSGGPVDPIPPLKDAGCLRRLCGGQVCEMVPGGEVWLAGWCSLGG